ncbi:cytochrome P450 6A1-like [Onthophagus taurus]|uniref:cytochrome P450 6A1-like n=1 Tax=Onthophagus taurus TaxID=166361 RepID=UPI0039BDFB53
MIIITIILSLSFVLFWYVIKRFYKTKHNYWNLKGIPYLTPSFPFGNFQNPLKLKKSTYLHLQDIYNQLKLKGAKIGGMYVGTMPSLLLIDPNIIKKVCVQDFQYFMDRGVHCDEISEPLSAHLFALSGQKWKNLRVKLTPTFTTGKMKIMFDILIECAKVMVQKMNDETKINRDLDIKEIVACYTTDVIASAAFGIKSNSFEENSQFRFYGRKLLVNTPARLFRVFFLDFYPNFAKKLGLTVFERDINDFFMKSVKDMIEYRESTNFRRNDFFQILLDLKNSKDKDQNLSVNELAAQAFVFFTAGFETSSTTMQFALYELSKHPEIQQKAREEVLNVLQKSNGEINYEILAEMKYLTQIIEETLRKYPPLPFLNRKCVKEYFVPECNVTIDEGTRIMIPLFGLHYDEEYFPNANEFNPERFNEINKPKIPPFAYLPFGDGPRVCIGLRFGMMQSKLGLALILKNFRFMLSEKTIEPVGFHKNNFLVSPEHTIYLNVTKL